MWLTHLATSVAGTPAFGRVERHACRRPRTGCRRASRRLLPSRGLPHRVAATLVWASEILRTLCVVPAPNWASDLWVLHVESERGGCLSRAWGLGPLTRRWPA